MKCSPVPKLQFKKKFIEIGQVYRPLEHFEIFRPLQKSWCFFFSSSPCWVTTFCKSASHFGITVEIWPKTTKSPRHYSFQICRTEWRQPFFLPASENAGITHGYRHEVEVLEYHPSKPEDSEFESAFASK